MKRRRLGAERLIVLGVAGKQRRDRPDTSSPAAAITPVVEVVAAALAARIVEPIAATFDAAAPSTSGAAITYDIGLPSQSGLTTTSR
jgi:hypothetical protein